MPVGTGKRVLQDLLGGVSVPGQVVGGPKDEGPVSDEEGLECIEVVRLHAANELRVGAAVRPGRLLRVIVVRDGCSRSCGYVPPVP